MKTKETVKDNILVVSDTQGKINIRPDGYIELIDTCSPPCVTGVMSGPTLLEIIDIYEQAKKVFAKFKGITIPDMPAIDHGSRVFLVDGNDNKLRGFDTDGLHIHIGCAHISEQDLRAVEAAVRQQLDR